MEKKRVVPIWVTVIYSLLCVGAIAIDVYGLFNNGIGAIGYLTYSVEIIATLLAACYCITGYKKSSSGFFKAVIIFLLITAVLTLTFIVSLQMYFQFYSELIVFGCLCVFAVAKDLGEKRSLIMALLMLISYAASAIYFVCNFGFNRYISPYITGMLISAIVLIMVIAKYRDKTARGTK